MDRKRVHHLTFWAIGQPNPNSFLTIHQLPDHSYTASVDEEPPIRYFVDQGFPRYHGRPDESLPDWLDEVKKYIRENNVKQEHEICIPLLYLSRDARGWYKDYYTDTVLLRPNSWEDFEQAITAEFAPQLGADASMDLSDSSMCMTTQSDREGLEGPSFSLEQESEDTSLSKGSEDSEDQSLSMERDDSEDTSWSMEQDDSQDLSFSLER